MTIIHVPNQHLRKKTHEVTELDDKVNLFIEQLKDTLDKKRNPRGVGLSAPQVDNSFSIFVTLLPPENNPEAEPIMRTFVNPQIVKTSAGKTFGENSKEPLLEGCLSIPHIWGPVPRFEWVEMEFQVPKDGQLVNKKEKFVDFTARVMQHELDHLQGILFTDYTLEYELPLYDDSSGKFKEIDRKIAEKF